jgi:excisionase family DNA binding protein
MVRMGKTQKENKMKKQSNATVYAVDELARELGVSRNAIYSGLRAGTIPSIRLGRRFILPRAAIALWLQSAGGRPAK